MNIMNLSDVDRGIYDFVNMRGAVPETKFPWSALSISAACLGVFAVFAVGVHVGYAWCERRGKIRQVNPEEQPLGTGNVPHQQYGGIPPGGIPPGDIPPEDIPLENIPPNP